MPYRPAHPLASTSPAPTPAPAATHSLAAQTRPRQGQGFLIDSLAFSNLLPAAIAVGFSAVASQILGAPNAGVSATLAGCGAFVVYALDRLRDTKRDGGTSPLRTRFTLRNVDTLYAALGLAGLGLMGGLVASPLRVILLCLAVGAVGLGHRRLKAAAALKTFYVSLAWVSGVVGIPWMMTTDPSWTFRWSPAAEVTPWLSAILFATLGANLIASNHRDGEARIFAGRPDWTLAIAQSLAATGILLALIGANAAAGPLRALAWIPLCQLGALVFYRPTEYYGHLAVDGALLIGAAGSLWQLQA